MEVKRIPSTSLTQSQAMQLINERIIGKFPQVDFVFSRGGTPDLAADPMPPSTTDTYVILKPRSDWPDPDLPKDDLIRDIAEQARKSRATRSASRSRSRCASTSSSPGCARTSR